MKEVTVLDNIVDIEGRKVGREKIEQFRGDFDYLITAGTPGSGKTTLLGEIGEEVADLDVAQVNYDETLRFSRKPDTFEFNMTLLDIIQSKNRKTLAEIPGCGNTVSKDRGVTALTYLSKSTSSTGFYIVAHPLLPVRRGMIIRKVINEVPPEERVSVLERDFGINVVVKKGSTEPKLVGERIGFLVSGMANEQHIIVIQSEINRFYGLLESSNPTSIKRFTQMARENLPESYGPEAILEGLMQASRLILGSELVNEAFPSWAERMSEHVIKEAAYMYNRFRSLGILDRFSIVFNPVVPRVNWYIEVPPEW